MVKSNFSTKGPLGTMIARKPGGGQILASNPRLLPAITIPPPPFPAGLIAALDTPRPAADNLSWIHLQLKRNSVFKSGPLKLITVIGQFSYVMVLAESLSTVICWFQPLQSRSQSRSQASLVCQRFLSLTEGTLCNTECQIM